MDTILRAMRPLMGELETIADDECPEYLYHKIWDLLDAYDALAIPRIEENSNQ